MTGKGKEPEATRNGKGIARGGSDSDYYIPRPSLDPNIRFTNVGYDPVSRGSSRRRRVDGLIAEEPLAVGSSSTPVAGPSDRFDYGFSDMLSLAISSWHGRRPITERSRITAWEVREAYANDAATSLPGPKIVHPQRAVCWMFMALVFEWPDILKAKAERVLIKYDPSLDDMNSSSDLPADFRALVTKTRKTIFSETYNNIRNNWIMLYNIDALHSINMRSILEHFLLHDIDLRKPIPEPSKEINALYLLNKLEEILRKLRKPRKAVFHGGTTRGGGMGALVRQGAEQKISALKQKMSKSSTDGSIASEGSSEQSEGWERRRSSLEHETIKWNESLSSGSFFIKEFRQLRDDNIPPIQEDSRSELYAPSSFHSRLP